MIPRPPTASGTTDSLAPYVVGALAAGTLAGLGLKIRDALTLIGLALSGGAGVFGYGAGRRGRGHEGL